jgi:eukaryotic-like serine/threonine-protein kinase
MGFFRGVHGRSREDAVSFDEYETKDIFDECSLSQSDRGGDSLDTAHSTLLELRKMKEVLLMKAGGVRSHYSNLHLIGTGSFGEVHGATDALLGREVAIKSLKSKFREDQEAVDRFLKEARGSAQLEHPNIIPVHEIGMMEELGVYFTMKKIEGETLKEVLDKLSEGNEAYQKKYSQVVLLGIFLSVCNGVAFAHSRGVIHRDLKPANIIIGEYGEVMVLDWGLVKHLGGEGADQGRIQLQMEEYEGGSKTLDGAISGTPNYMPPEQAAGQIDEIDFQSDVYSLGAILYHILAYVPPFERTPLRQLLDNVKKGNFEAPRKRRPMLKIPRELDAICMKALARNKVCRYASVDALVKDIRNYMGNYEVTAYRAPRAVRAVRWCKRHPVKSGASVAVLVALFFAFSLLQMMAYSRYLSRIDGAKKARAAGDAALLQAKKCYLELEALPARVLQELSEEERRLQGELEQLLSEVEEHYSLALLLYRGIPETYQHRSSVTTGYRRIMLNRIEFALFRKDYVQVLQWLRMVREWAGNNVKPDLERYISDIEAQIAGKCRLEIVGPEQAGTAILYPLGKDDGQLVLMDPVMKGALPRSLDELPWGSYVLTVQVEGMGRVVFPIMMERGEQRVFEVKIPDRIPEGMVYVPVGEAYIGGPQARYNRLHKRHVDGFFIRRLEVSFGEYIAFWRSLSRPEERERYMSLLRLDADQRIPMRAWDEQGILLDERVKLEHPVVGITQEGAAAYCAWLAEETGRPIRLPTAVEWEKAARGVDGRTYVWGDGLFDSFALTLDNERGRSAHKLWAPPGSFMKDVSVYGAYDMAGNVREWTASTFPGKDNFYEVKGASLSTPSRFLPLCYSSDAEVVPSDIGFRYIEEL